MKLSPEAEKDLPLMEKLLDLWPAPKASTLSPVKFDDDSVKLRRDAFEKKAACILNEAFK